MAGFLARIVGGLLRDRTLQAGTGITITNPAGDAGDPTISATNTNTGTVTNTTGALTLNQIVLGNGGSDIKPQGSLGTNITVLHGNAAGAPSFGALNLATDVTGIASAANLPANVAYNNIDNHFVAQTLATGCEVDAAASPTFYLHDQSGAADTHFWRLILSGGNFLIQAMTDALVSQGTFAIDRAAGNITLFGGQIAFPATQNPSTNVNTLDDYEEGTWTPNDQSGAGLTFSTATGFYIKIGRKVFVTATVVYPVTASGILAKWGGLPFTAQVNQPAGGGSFTFYTLNNNATVFVRENTTNVEIFTTAGGNYTNANFSTLSFIIQATYMAVA